jgi:hypothetical protein
VKAASDMNKKARLRLIKSFLAGWKQDPLYGPFWLNPNSPEYKKLKWIYECDDQNLMNRIEKMSRLEVLAAHKISNSVIDNLFQYALIFHSLDNYRPDKVKKLLHLWLRHLGFQIKKHYGPWGADGVDSTIGWLIFYYARYLILNEDWKGLERFAKQFSQNTHATFHEEIAIIITVLLKRNPHPKILSTAIMDYSQRIEKPKGKINDWIESNPFIYWFCTKKKKDPHKLLYNIFSDFDQHRSWFYDEYIDAGKIPGIRRSKEKHILTIFPSGAGSDLRFPPDHEFSRFGVPETCVGTQYDTWKSFGAICAAPLKEFHNRIRDAYGVPRIGEGWVGEMTLLAKIRKRYSHLRIVHQYRPEWLSPQSIDIAIPDFKILIEYHGTQHYKPVEYFGGKKAFLEQCERDKNKAKLSKENGFKLLVFNEKDSDNRIFNLVDKALSRRGA